jgi:protoheme IX farnesyltransferase
LRPNSIDIRSLERVPTAISTKSSRRDGAISLDSIALFLINFMWTPPHFWSLSLYRAGDYAKAAVPMPPVVAGKAETRRQILIYTTLLVPLSFAPLVLGWPGSPTARPSRSWAPRFLLIAVQVLRERGGRAARRMFRFSILYLFVLFAALIIEHASAAALAQLAEGPSTRVPPAQPA